MARYFETRTCTTCTKAFEAEHRTTVVRCPDCRRAARAARDEAAAARAGAALFAKAVEAKLAARKARAAGDTEAYERHLADVLDYRARGVRV